VLKGFRDFLMRGNVVDLAVAVVVGAAFALIVSSFTNDILMPIIGIIGGQPKFDYFLTIRGSEIKWGNFITVVINFLIVAFAVFLVVKGINKMQGMRKLKEGEAEEVELTELDLLTEIRDLLVAQNAGTSTAPGAGPGAPPTA
jgi:large conductance mechanosensitive channel